MAKKNLINADMLLATPRKAPEPTISMAEETFKVTIHEQIELSGDGYESAPVQPISSVKRGLKSTETRATFIVDEKLVEKLKAVAYWERLNIKDVINAAFEKYLNDFEKQHGLIKPVPQNRKPL